LSFIEELKRRKVIRVGIAYVIGAWLVLQLSDVLSELLSLPEQFGPVVVAIVAIGFPIVLVLAWAFEFTSAGLKRESEVAPNERSTGKGLNALVVALLVVALAYFVWESRFSTPGSNAEQGTQQAGTSAAEETVIGRSIAVLPFENFSGNADDAYFADGLTDTLLHKLAQISELKVIARNSSFQFKGSNQDVREIGEILGVDTVLEGSVQRAGSQVRVIAQLVRTSDGAHLWSRTFDDSMDNIFDLQDRITASIVDAFALSLSEAERQRLLRDGTDNPQAYDLLIRALNTDRNLDEMTDTSAEEDAKIALIRQSIAADPNYALAWAELSRAYSALAFAADSTADFDRYVAEAQAAADEAHRLDPSLSAAHNALGWVAHRKNESNKAAGHFRKALEIDPNNLGAMSGLALQVGRSDPEAMLVLLNRLTELDPTEAFAYRQKHFALLILGRREQAIEQIKKAIELEPSTGIFYADLVNLLRYGGRPDQAAVWTSKLLRLTPNSFDGQMAMANAWLSAAQFERAGEWITLALQPRPDSDAAKALEVRRLIGAGEYQRALEALEDVRETESGSYVHAISAGSACMGLRQAECVRQQLRTISRLLEEAKLQGSAFPGMDVLPAIANLVVDGMENPASDNAPEAGQLLQAVLADNGLGFEDAYFTKAGLAARMGDSDQAFGFLETSITGPDGAVFNDDWFGLSAEDSRLLDPLRSDARFDAWLARHQARREAMRERMLRLERDGEIISVAAVQRMLD
jgi:TolB-like protein/Flp pilus assembly protein TadD